MIYRLIDSRINLFIGKSLRFLRTLIQEVFKLPCNSRTALRNIAGLLSRDILHDVTPTSLNFVGRTSTSAADVLVGLLYGTVIVPS